MWWSLLKLMSIESVMPSNHHSSSVFPFSSCLQSFPASESSPMSWLFASGGQSTGASTSASLLPMNIQSWFPLGLTGLISLLSKELSKSILHYSLKTSVLQCSAFFMIHLLHPSITTGHIALTMQTFVSKIMSLLFNMLSRFVIDFLPKSKRLLISWLQSLSAVILKPQENKICHHFPFPPSVCQEVTRPDVMILFFWCCFLT